MRVFGGCSSVLIFALFCLFSFDGMSDRREGYTHKHTVARFDYLYVLVVRYSQVVLFFVFCILCVCTSCLLVAFFLYTAVFVSFFFCMLFLFTSYLFVI